MFLTYLWRELRRLVRQASFITVGLAFGIGLAITVTAASGEVKTAQASVLHSLYGVGTDITVTKTRVGRLRIRRVRVRLSVGRNGEHPPGRDHGQPQLTQQRRHAREHPLLRGSPLPCEDQLTRDGRDVHTWRLAPRTHKPVRFPLNQASLEHAGRLPAPCCAVLASPSGEAAVTAQPIAPVIPAVARPGARRRTGTGPTRQLPLADVPELPAAAGGVLYGFGRIDASGRVADRAVTRALGWLAGGRPAGPHRRRGRDHRPPRPGCPVA